MAKVRVLVVEDSLTVRARLRELLSRDDEIEIVGEAADGKTAIELCGELRPDAISLDMMLPVMSGVAATEYIMAYCPTPILIVSSSFNRGELFETYDALAAGAVDVLEKPRGDESDVVWERKFISTMKLIARIKVVTHPRARLAAFGPARAATPAPIQPSVQVHSQLTLGHACKVIVLGTSTGGPGALVEVLRAIPPDTGTPILFVMHIDEAFGAAFAQWLEVQTSHRVVCARGGEPLDACVGRVVMAPPGRHLVVRSGRLHLTDDPERHSCRPSVDVLFESVSREIGANVVACLLTGMGRDGAAGLLEIKRAGGLTIAQDEASSIVYGMPREAALLGAADRVLPLSDIGPAVAALVRAREGAKR